MAPMRDELFVSRLARLPVTAPGGELVGRIADVVVARSASGSAPVVLGLVVSSQRRPIFVGMTRLSLLDPAGAALRSGQVNLRRFALRGGETLVLGELLDTRVRHRETDEPRRINDVAIAQGRTGWRVSTLDVVERGSKLA